MSTLYTLTGEYMQLLEMAQEPDIDEQCLKDTMEAIEGELEDKAEGYAKIMKQLEAEAAAIDAEVKRLNERKSSLKNNADRMKKALQAAMEATGKTKFKTTLFSFGIQNNPPALVLAEGAAIPEQYLIPQEPKVDNAAIKAALKDGQQFDFASLKVSQSLRIR